MAFLASGVIKIIKKLIDKLKLSDVEIKDFFIKSNERSKPLKNMPLYTEVAWKKLSKEIKKK